jgi:hypothetical protein
MNSGTSLPSGGPILHYYGRTDGVFEILGNGRGARFSPKIGPKGGKKWLLQKNDLSRLDGNSCLETNKIDPRCK